jgi:hypothetical protein
LISGGQAGLPMIEVRHLHREPKWVSLPFTDYCPPLISAQQHEARLNSAPLLLAALALGFGAADRSVPFSVLETGLLDEPCHLATGALGLPADRDLQLPDHRGRIPRG